MKNLYRSYFVIGAVWFVFFGYTLIELLNTEKRLGFSPVNSWAILSDFGKFCFVMCGVVLAYLIIVRTIPRRND